MMRVLIWCLLPLSICFSQGTREKRIQPVEETQKQGFEKQVKVALLVGIGAYPQGSGLSALKYPAQDVALLGDELTRQGYLVRRVVDSEASRGVVRRALNELADALEPGQGTFVFYYSGHGFAQDGVNYLATFGATVDDLRSEGLPVGEVESLLAKSKARQRILWLDACRNDPNSTTRSATQRSFADLNASEGLKVLFSTRAGRVSYENDELHQGLFTHFLVRGLRGEAAGADGLVTFRDLADFVVDGVRAYGVQHGQVQIPYEAGESSGDFLIARAMASRVPAAPVANLPPSAPANPPSVGPRPGDIKVNSRDGLKYVWIPPGRFMMGCSPGDSECSKNENQAHEVEIPKGFWIGQTHVTQNAYQQLIGKNPSHFKGANLPVDEATWEEAKTYCMAIGRLPTEAEWEYAARAGSAKNRYGDIDRIAWYNGNSGKRTHEVAQKEPNAWGLYDMLGNVWQWTSDKYEISAFQRWNYGVDSYKKCRGGSWQSRPEAVRASSVIGYDVYVAGFRCVGE